MNIKDFLIKESIGDFKIEESLSLHTSYKIGGLCSYFVYPSDIDKLMKLIKFLKDNNIMYRIIGNGSNVIFSSKKFEGVIINLSKINNIKIDDNIIKVDAGYPLIKLSNVCANNSLAGLEFISGIPGNVGGAIYMNAGAYKSEVSDFLLDVTYLDEDNNLVTKNSNELDFGYRTSIFKHKKYIILSATFKLEKGDKNDILELINDRRNRRIESQPLDYPSAGSVFRNPGDNIYAGKLIEDLGLKGFSIGGAKISEKHANFIINYNNATGEDVKALIDFVKEKVKEKYNIELKVEQELINF